MLEDSINRFVADIKDTQEYKEFVIRRDILAQYPELKSQASLLAREHFRLLKSTPADKLLEAEKKFAEQYETIYNTPMIHEYLDAEAAINRLLRDVLEQVTGGLTL